MAYKISAQRYNKRMDKIFDRYREQQEEKNKISKKVYKIEYDKLSYDKKHKIDYLWGEQIGI